MLEKSASTEKPVFVFITTVAIFVPTILEECKEGMEEFQSF